MEWDQAINHFSSNYTRARDYYSYLADNALDDDARFYYAWMYARASKLDGLPYEKYKRIYVRAYEKHPNRVETLFELAETAPREDKLSLLKECIYLPLPSSSTRWVQKEIYLWRALKRYIEVCKESGLTHEAYDAWRLLLRREDCIPENERNECREIGKKPRKILFADVDNYNIFQSQLGLLPKFTFGDIPNIVHIVWVSGHRTYSMIQYLTVKTAYFVQRPIKIYVYNDVEPANNVWWERTKSYAEIVHIVPPKFVNKNKIPWAQHVADLMRIWIMYVRGGIYLDADLLLVKPLDSILVPGKLTMCRETDEKLWNGFLAAPPKHPFFGRWIREYETKYGTEKGGCWWAGLSVETPAKLYKQTHESNALLHLVPNFIFLPFGFHDDTFFHCYVDNMYSESLGIHLWETETEKRGVLPKEMSYFESNPDTGFSKFFGKYAG